MVRVLIRLAAVVVAAGVLAACSSGGSSSDTPTPSAERPGSDSPQRLCAHLVTYWAKDQLRPEGGLGDYQEMGLSDGQNAILRAILPEARAERRKHGAAAARALVAREARKRCDQRYANGTPTTR